jgi:hypothetical protein
MHRSQELHARIQLFMNIVDNSVDHISNVNIQMSLSGHVAARWRWRAVVQPEHITSAVRFVSRSNITQQSAIDTAQPSVITKAHNSAQGSL